MYSGGAVGSGAAVVLRFLRGELVDCWDTRDCSVDAGT